MDSGNPTLKVVRKETKYSPTPTLAMLAAHEAAEKGREDLPTRSRGNRRQTEDWYRRCRLICRCTRHLALSDAQGVKEFARPIRLARVA